MGLRTASVRRPSAMAPALTDAQRTQPDGERAPMLPHVEDSTREGFMMNERPGSMGDQNKMGLQKTGIDSVAKIHKSDVDQLLNNLTSNDVDLSQNVDEFMQVIKSIDSEDNLTIEKFLTDVDMMNISMEDQQELETQTLKETQSKDLISELKKRQNKIERRLDFLRRKIRKLQARNMGQHVSNEVAGVYEYVHRSLKRLKDTSLQIDVNNDERMKPMSCGSTKTLLKKLEMAAALQANSVARQKHLPKYFGSGSCETNNSRINVPGIVNIPPWPMEHKQELQKVTGLLHTELSLVQRDVDSEATESSSGGESCDEMQNYNNPHQQYLSIQKRALWKYAATRASIASRWTWLQAQISDLEYRIRQHTDLHRQIRTAKGDVRLGGLSPPASPAAVNGYRGQLPGSSAAPKGADGDGDDPREWQCARTRPLRDLRKRRLVQVNGLHAVSKKAARPSTVRCGCARHEVVPCALCTGRTDPTDPRDPTDALSRAERVALVDAAFHPVFSMADDISYGIHCEAIMKNPEWQQRSTRMKSLKIMKNDRSEKASLDHRAKKLDHRKKYNRLLKPSTVSALSAKIKSKIRGRKVGRHSSSSASSTSFRKRSRLSISHLSMRDDGADDEVESIGNNSNAAAPNSAVASPSSSPLLHMQTISGYNRRTRANSYDIDNIVIPYSVAASTRVEKLQYKEILTPKWRIADIDFKCDTKNNGAVRNPSQDSDAEDLSEEAVIVRHDKSEYEEKKKFLSYLKLPIGHGRHRSHKRTDSLAESSGANTPDAPQSPRDGAFSPPLASPPATPLAADEPPLRRRTVSQSRPAAAAADGAEAEAAPFDARTFPLDDDTYEKMLRNMPENHQFKTNVRAQDYGYLEDKVDSPGSESTESALGEEDPNDPEWVDMERVRDRHKR